MTGKRLVAIHQPNFFPWLGFFDKIARADVFVVLDDAQLKKSGSWSNRVRVLMGGRSQWLSVPIDRSYEGHIEIREARLDSTRSWQRLILNTIRMNYARTPFFDDVYSIVCESVEAAGNSLCALNLSAIRLCCARLGLAAEKLVLASTFPTALTATDRLIALVKSTGGTAYLSGGGAAGYQEDEKFGAAGLDLVYQSFEHPVYPQHGSAEFVPGLSILDAAMNCGWDGTARLLNA